MSHDSSVFTAPMCCLHVNSNLFRPSSFLNLFGDGVCQLLLQSSSSWTPLCYSWIFAKSYEFVFSKNTDVSYTCNRLVMVTAYASYFASYNQHSIKLLLALIRKRGCFWLLLVSSNKELIKIHLSKPLCCLFTVWIILSIY